MSLIKFSEFINEEVGIRNLKKIIEGFENCEIYFHKDLDGVCTALAVKEFMLRFYNIKTVDCHIIQYGSLEFAIKDKKPGNMAIVCDFAHSKPMFTLAFDHHDKQVGAGDTEATYFKPARSNVEIISGEISYTDLFTPQDIELIKTVDSANFVTHKITPDDIQKSIFEFKREFSGAKNRFMMGFIVNRLLLAYKNKRISVKSLNGEYNHINKNILECLVLDSNPSLYSMFNNLRNYINNAKTSDRSGKLATPQEITQNLQDYIKRMKDYRFIETETGDIIEFDPLKHKEQSDKKILKGVHFDDKYNILIQYGGGSMIKPGSYDRYTPFKNYPDADFLCIIWPLGLIQVSCNPFKEKKLKDINLGDISKEVMSNHEQILKPILVSLKDIKNEYETSQDWKKMQKEEGKDYSGVGFRFTDLMAFYGDCVFKVENDKFSKFDPKSDEKLIECMNKTYEKMSVEELDYLRNFKISVWELVVRNSGGHPSITNIQGFNFLKFNKPATNIAYGVEKYTEVMKKIGREFVNNLKSKIDDLEAGKGVQYKTSGVEFKGADMNESFDYYLVKNNGVENKVTKEEFVKAGHKKAMRPKNPNDFKIDTTNKRIVAKFESFKLK